MPLLGAPGEFLITRYDFEHHRARRGIVNLVSMNTRLFGAVAPMLCVVDQALFHG
jgi:hypothetical protein